MEQITVTITAGAEEMLKIKRVLAWMHYNSAWGHTGVIATSIDGDGSNRVVVEGMDDLKKHKDKAKRPSAYREMWVEWMGSEPNGG